MPDRLSRPTAKQTLLLILLPLLGTVLCLRLYLHLVRVQHIYPGGLGSVGLRMDGESGE
jgi:hypothetical protein